MMANFIVQAWADSRVLENPTSSTSLLFVSRHDPEEPNEVPGADEETKSHLH